MTRHLLVLNAGSATLKWSAWRLPGLTEHATGEIERIGLPGSFATFRVGRSAGKTNIGRRVTPAAAAAFVFDHLPSLGVSAESVAAVGHRFVHGGSAFVQPTPLNSRVLQRLAKLDALAPLHNPASRQTAIVARRRLPAAPQIAVFDTAFFAQLPVVARTYALPTTIAKKFGIRRYGFHGLSHASAAQQAARQLRRPIGRINLITLHLGSGCSVAAISRGRPLDTSMGFTPLEGLVMMSRSGDLDPGIILHLLRAGFSTKELDDLLTRQSGIMGLAGTRDFRDVRFGLGEPVAASGGVRVSRPVARLAFDVFVYRVRKYLGAYAAVLGRVDAVVFTGGIGERSALVRSAILRQLRLPGRPVTLVALSNEERVIARAVRRFAR